MPETQPQLFRFHVTYLDEDGQVQHNYLNTTDPKWRRRLDSPERLKMMEEAYKELGITFLQMDTIESVAVDSLPCTEEPRRAVKREPLKRVV